MSGLKEALAAAGDREVVTVEGLTVLVKSCRLAERLEFLRLSAAAAAETDPFVQAMLALRASGYLVAATVHDPDTGARVFDRANPDDVADQLAAPVMEQLGLVAVRVSGLDKLAQEAAKNASRASDESSIASPETSAAPSRSSEDDSPPTSTPSD